MTHQSIMAEKSQEALDAAGDSVSAVKRERATDACAQLPFFFLYSPGSQSREWCHTQWAGLPTSKTYQDHPLQACPEVHFLGESKSHQIDN